MFLKKIAIVSFLIISSMNLYGNLLASSDQYIDETDFTLMTYSQKVETIRMVHKFLSEHEYISRVDEFSSKKKYSLYQKIWNKLISNAYAQIDVGSVNMGKTCYYGGWISVMVNGKCSHPKRLTAEFINRQVPKSSNSDLNQLLLKNVSARVYDQNASSFKVVKGSDNKITLDTASTASACNGPREIICNPLVYGTVDGKNICVSGNNAWGLNSSYLCSEAIESLPSEQKNKVFQDIIKNSNADSDNKDGFFFTLRAMFDMCLCKGDSKTVNSQYSERMFYSRTCYAVLKQAEALRKDLQTYACQNLDEKTTPDGVKTWKQFLNEAGKVLEQQVSQLKLDNLTNIQIGSISASSVQKSMQDDNDKFKAIRDQQYSGNSKSGLCPLSGGPELKANYNQNESVIKAEVINVSDDAEIKDWKNANCTDGLKIELVESTDNLRKDFKVTENTLTQNCDVIISAIINGVGKEAKVIIPPLSSKEPINCNISEVAPTSPPESSDGDEDEEEEEGSTQIQFKIVAGNIKKAQLAEGYEFKYGEQKIELEEFGTPFTIAVDEIDRSQISFNGETIDGAPISCTGAAQSEEQEVEDPDNSCSVTIATSANGDTVNLKANITGIDPSKVTINWSAIIESSSQTDASPSSSSSSRTISGTTDSSVEDGNDITSTPITDTDNKQSINVSKKAKKQTIKVSISGENCDASSQKQIAAKQSSNQTPSGTFQGKPLQNFRPLQLNKNLLRGVR